METETLEIDIQGTAATSPVHDVQEWITQEKIPGLRVEQKASPVTGDEMGGLGTVLSAILDPKHVKRLVTSLYNYLFAKQSKLKLTVKSKNWEVTLDGENLRDQEAVLKHFESLVAAARSK